MGLFRAARVSNRMGARQQYRTMARMHRRRTFLQNSMGMGNDFSSPQEETTTETITAQPDYTAELQRLSQLKNQGLITEEEFSAKKKQILGI